MNFRSLVFANIKKSFKKYLSYYLSGSFCIAMFFIFLTLIFNEGFSESTTEYPLTMYFAVALSSIGVFSVFFISYAHYTFIKNRYKEFGVYMVSGMSTKDLNKMLFIEIIVIYVLSIITGLAVGSIFGNLIQLVVGKLLDIETEVSLSWQCYLVTFGVFLVIYGVIFLFALIKVNKMDISSLMKQNQKKETNGIRKRDYVFAALGLVSAVFSIVFMLTLAGNNEVNTKLYFVIPYITTTFLGIIGLANYGLKVILALLHKTKLFSKNMLAITQMEQKFGQNHRVILILSIMAALIVLSVGAPTALVSLTDNIVTDGGFDVEYGVLNNIPFDEEKIEKIITSKEIKTRDSYTFLVGYLDGNLDNMKYVISNSDYNKWNDTNVNINDGECYNVITTWEPGDHGVPVGSSMNFKLGNIDYSLTIINSSKGKTFGRSIKVSDSVICVSDKLYTEMTKLSNLTTLTVNRVEYVDNYKNTKDISDQIMASFIPGMAFTRYFNYSTLKSGYNTFLFVSITQSVMFFISTGFVLFFKQMNELNENKEEFNKLYKIGITDKEMTRVISHQLRIVYFTPIILGTIFGFSIMYYMTNLFAISDDNSKFLIEFMKFSAIAALSYLVVQVMMYFYTKFMYKHNVLYK